MASRVTKQMLKEQIEALREENARLMDEIGGEPLRTSAGAGSLALEESKVVLEAHRQATEDLQAELAESLERNRELDRACSELHEQMQQVTMEAELEKLRAVENKHSKWEARKERLVQQLQGLRSQLSATTRKQSEPSLAPARSPSGVAGSRSTGVVVTACTPPRNTSTDPCGDVSATCTDKGTDKPNVPGGASANNADTGAANCMPTIDSVGNLLLAQQMPQIAKFSGEDVDNEPFDDWLTQFEMIAGLLKWEGLAKLSPSNHPT